MIKLFVIKKYIEADSIEDAIKKDKKASIDSIWIDEEWKNAMLQKDEVVLGFSSPKRSIKRPRKNLRLRKGLQDFAE